VSPSRSLANKIFWPSGDHDEPKSAAGFVVRFVRPVPSGFIT
jgi:hypothetical protein